MATFRVTVERTIEYMVTAPDEDVVWAKMERWVAANSDQLTIDSDEIEIVDVELVDDADALPPCRLSGTDGNVFAIIGTVSRCLKRANQQDQANEWSTKAMNQDSYSDVIALASEYVRVS